MDIDSLLSADHPELKESEQYAFFLCTYQISRLLVFGAVRKVTAPKRKKYKKALRAMEVKIDNKRFCNQK